MYGMDMARNDNFLGNAAGLAQLQAKMAAMDAEEHAMGGPGRMVDIRTKNTLSMDAEAGLPDTLEQRGMARKNAISAERQKKIQEGMKEMEPFINSWAGAKDEDKPSLYEMMKDQDVGFGDKRVKSMSFQDTDAMMKALRKAQEMGLGHVAKMAEIEGKNQRVAATNTSREKIAQMKAELAAAIQNSKNDVANAKLSLGQLHAKYIKAGVDSGKYTPQQAIDYMADLVAFPAQEATGRQPGKPALVGNKVVIQKPTAGGTPRLKPSEEAPAEEEAPKPPEAKKTQAPAAAIAAYKQKVAAAKGDKARIDSLNKQFTDMGWEIPK